MPGLQPGTRATIHLSRITTARREPRLFTTLHPRSAAMAVLILDTRVAGKYPPRDVFRNIGPPVPLTARRIAARLAEATGYDVTGDDVQEAYRLLRSTISTPALRTIAQSYQHTTTERTAS